LQCAARQNKSVKFHEFLWTKIKKYFNSQEILDMINQCDADGNRLFFNVIARNTREIVELTWKEIKKKFIKSKKDQITYLKTKGFDKHDLLQAAFKNEEHSEEMQSWTKCLVDEYGINFDDSHWFLWIFGLCIFVLMVIFVCS